MGTKLWLGVGLCIALLRLSVSSVIAADAPPMMAVAGQFDVSPTGAATYAIPIKAPPGTAGMEPAISLVYSSETPNGIVGLGWSLQVASQELNNSGPTRAGSVASSSMLAATSTAAQAYAASFAAVGSQSQRDSVPDSITRCPQTYAQDGVHGGVNYNSSDRFCLGSRRLVVVAGSYGANNSEYRTEIDIFAKIVAHTDPGYTGSGPAWFEIHTREGKVLEFGRTTDARVIAAGNGTARSWLLNKATDTKGNYFLVSYNVDAANSQAYPAKIEYTGNSNVSIAPYNRVEFLYSSRVDVVPYYQAGSLEQTTSLLSEIRTYEGANLVLVYKLD